MNGLGTAPRFRAAAVWAATTVGLVLLLRWCAPDLPGPATPSDFAELVVTAAASALAGCGCWWWSVTTVVVLQVWRGGGGRLPGVPPAARRLLLAACGVALVGATASPALATPGSLHHDRDRPARSAIDGLPLPERPLGDLRPAQGPTPAPAESVSTVVVSSGDSLWSIAAARLGSPATDAELTAYWQRLYRLNRTTIGADPDLVRPGQRLVLPDQPSS